MGLFWTGRESTHGLAAFAEHRWCPIPLALILLGLGAMMGFFLDYVGGVLHALAPHA